MFISSTFEEGVVPTVFYCNSIAQFKVLQYLLQNLKVLQYVLPNFKYYKKYCNTFKVLQKLLKKVLQNFKVLQKELLYFAQRNFLSCANLY